MNSDYQEQIAGKIRADPFACSLGIELLELRPGYSRMTMKLTKRMKNFLGIPHGGAIFSLADAAFAAASNSHGTQAVALQMTISYLAAVPIETNLYAAASEEKLGKRTALYRITVSDEADQLIASCQGMVYRKEKLL